MYLTSLFNHIDLKHLQSFLSLNNIATVKGQTIISPTLDRKTIHSIPLKYQREAWHFCLVAINTSDIISQLSTSRLLIPTTTCSHFGPSLRNPGLNYGGHVNLTEIGSFTPTEGIQLHTWFRTTSTVRRRMDMQHARVRCMVVVRIGKLGGMCRSIIMPGGGQWSIREKWRGTTEITWVFESTTKVFELHKELDGKY